jgi:hypothetical protein
LGGSENASSFSVDAVGLVKGVDWFFGRSHRRERRAIVTQVFAEHCPSGRSTDDQITDHPGQADTGFHACCPKETAP